MTILYFPRPLVYSATQMWLVGRRLCDCLQIGSSVFIHFDIYAGFLSSEFSEFRVKDP